MAANTASSSSASSSTGPSFAAIKSSFTFPARPAQQQQQQHLYHHNTQVTAYTGPSSSTTACAPYNPRQQSFISHTPQQPSLSTVSRKSSASSGSDPFAYDRASLHATLASTTNPSRHTPRSSLASLNGITQAASISSATSPALSSAGASDRNKDLPPQPASSPVKNGQATLLASTSASTVTAVPAPESQAAPTVIHAPAEYVQALHDYAAVPADGSANICLSFHAGDFIKVLNRDASGWWDGEIHGTRGWFPSNYVVCSTCPIQPPRYCGKYANAKVLLHNRVPRFTT